MIPPNVLTFSPLTGGCSEGLGAFRDTIRTATKNPSEIRQVHMKDRRVECRRKNAQGNYKPFQYRHHASINSRRS